MTKEYLLAQFENCELTTDTLRPEDQPFIPNWKYELLADIILDKVSSLQGELDQLRNKYLDDGK